MITVTLLLVFSAFIITIVHVVGRAPLWPAVLLLIILHLLGTGPVR